MARPAWARFECAHALAPRELEYRARLHHARNPDDRVARRRPHAAAYAQRTNKVLDPIDAHLDAGLDLATLAA